MPLGNPSEGFQNAQAYQAPGLPFVRTTSSQEQIKFPNVSRSIHVTADGGDVAVYFAENAPATRQFTVKSGTTIELSVRVKDLWVNPASAVSVFAALTTIPRDAMPVLTGSNWEGIE